MLEAEKMTTTPPEGTKPIDPRMLDLHDQIGRVRDMVALARVAAHAVHMDGCEDAARGLSWVMHLAQDNAAMALSDLDKVMGRLGA